MGGTSYSLVVALAMLLKIAAVCGGGGITSNYLRKERPSIDMPLEAFPPPSGYNAPEQVHITQGDCKGRSVIISWVTPSEPGLNTVTYGTLDGSFVGVARCSKVTSYTFYNYTSGFIHHCTIHDLQYNTQYFYELGEENAARAFTFTTPPALGPDVPYTFGLIGDLGQTYDSNQTLENYMAHTSSGAVLYVGDLSYADHYPYNDQRRWDAWGRFVEKSTAHKPWIWTAGNHELDFLPEIGETRPFKPYKHRYHVPYKASKSTSPLWYSLKRASAHIIVLSSYSAYGKYTPQYQWLQNELAKVKRHETPWLIILVHSPWYNSYNYHYMEGETMRVMFEPWLVQNKVDIVFSGHVHGYERMERVSNVAYNITNRQCSPKLDPRAPIYITVGDGGNVEGRSNSFTYPQPEYSAYREASFGHAILDIKNRTHAEFTWYRNDGGSKGATIGDSVWIYNRHFHA